MCLSGKFIFTFDSFKLNCFLVLIALSAFSAPFCIDFCQASEHSEKTVISPYVNEETDYKIDPEALRDLQASLERARIVLKRTVEKAAPLGGEVLHRHLRSGIEEALAQSKLRNDLLLFRIVLTRALELDRMIQEAVKGVMGKELATQIILFPSIGMALKYYVDQDVANTQTLQISIPDWKKFAESQIPFLLRAVAFAPSKQLKVEFMKRALGWTAKAFHTSSESRRSMAEKIDELTQSLSDLETQTTDETLLKSRRIFSQIADDRQTPPVSNKSKLLESGWQKKPSDANPTEKKASLSFPLLDGKYLRLFHVSNYTGKYFEHSLQLGAGVGPQTRSSAGEVASNHQSMDARAKLHYELNAGLNDNNLSGVDVSARIDATVSGSMGSKNKPHQFSIETSANAICALGVLFAVEVNQFEGFSEEIYRLGWTGVGRIRIKDGEYVLIQPSIGYSSKLDNVTQNPYVKEAFRPQDFDKFGEPDESYFKQGWYASFLGAMRLSKFFVKVKLDVSHQMESRSSGSWEAVNGGKDSLYKGDDADGDIFRSNVQVEAVIPLGLIHPNDALTLAARWVHYELRGAYTVKSYSYYNASSEKLDAKKFMKKEYVDHGEIGITYGLSF